MKSWGLDHIAQPRPRRTTSFDIQTLDRSPDAGGNAVERNVDWVTIAKDWVGNSDSGEGEAANEDAPAN